MLNLKYKQIGFALPLFLVVMCSIFLSFYFLQFRSNNDVWIVTNKKDELTNIEYKIFEIKSDYFLLFSGEDFKKNKSQFLKFEINQTDNKTKIYIVSNEIFDMDNISYSFDGKDVKTIKDRWINKDAEIDVTKEFLENFFTAKKLVVQRKNSFGVYQYIFDLEKSERKKLHYFLQNLELKFKNQL